MSERFRNKYRIPSARLANWDYRWQAPYFITICIKNRKHYFGRIANEEMELSEIGKIVEYEWIRTFEMRPDMHLQMDEYQIMPNHFHAIIIIGENQYNQHKQERNADRETRRTTDDAMGDDGGGRRDAMHCGRDAMHCVSTVENPKNQFGPQSKNLGSIIRGFKSAVTNKAHPIQPDFCWQSRFHDHIIRDEESFRRVQTNIRENPLNWDEDEFNTDSV